MSRHLTFITQRAALAQRLYAAMLLAVADDQGMIFIKASGGYALRKAFGQAVIGKIAVKTQPLEQTPGIGINHNA